MNSNILIVDDEKSIREMILVGLKAEENYHFFEAKDAMVAKRILTEKAIDLIILDWMLPNINGINFIHQIRQMENYQNVGIIMLTAKDDTDDIVRALDMGADDFITKPFFFSELISRTNALLRRLSSNKGTAVNLNSNESPIYYENLCIDKLKRQILIDGQPVSFSPIEFDLLYFLATNTNRAYSRQEILNQVWGEDIYIDERTIDVHVRRIRRVLEAYQCSHFITTVRGIGYRFSFLD